MTNNVYLLRKAMAKNISDAVNKAECTSISQPVSEPDSVGFYSDDTLDISIARLPAKLRMSVGSFYTLSEYTRSNTYLSLAIQYQHFYKRVKQLMKNGLSFVEFNNVEAPKDVKEARTL